MVFQPTGTPDDLALAQSDVPHFQESGGILPVRPGDRLPGAVYSTALDYLVIACTDIVFTHAEQVLLARRNCYPNPSWWIIGGRMTAGEDPKASAQRKAAEEAALPNLALSRFRYVGAYSTRFAFRHQPPQAHGLHSLNLAYQVELTQIEKEQFCLSQDEYDTWKWVEIGTVQDLLDPNREMDRALWCVIRDVQRRCSAEE